MHHTHTHIRARETQANAFTNANPLFVVRGRSFAVYPFRTHFPR